MTSRRAITVSGILTTMAFATIGITVDLHVCAQIPTTLDDFFLPGSQPSSPEVQYDPFRSSVICVSCHETDGTGQPNVVIGPWQGSMMAQAARDPLFYACLTIANQDAAFVGDICIRCHSAGGWLSGRSEPTDGSALTRSDRDGVSCNVCHRMVDPVFKPNVSPAVDETILDNISPLPVIPGGANYVMDPLDVRRGPYDDIDQVQPGHPWLHSPFHRSPELCATCHDVSNPVYARQPDDTYVPDTLGAAFTPEAGKYAMFPLERTYSEWLHSEFAQTGVDMGGRFGGSLTVVRTCQDCHMPVTEGRGCEFGLYRDDLRAHEFAGGNAWVQDMVWNLYADEGLNFDYLQQGKDNATAMLQRACTLNVTQSGSLIKVRIINETGHKLPTGYPEGRRMWINVKVLDDSMTLIREFGGYDPLMADLTTNDTKVYEVHLGLDETMAALTGLPVGKGFHFAVNNVVLKDNRIPPRGFLNQAYQEVQAKPIGTYYSDGQYWDVTAYPMPIGAASVEVNVFYQTASKEYITFLRDANVTNNDGDILYDQWEQTGKSPPVLMATAAVDVQPFATGDHDANLRIDIFDYSFMSECYEGPSADRAIPSCEVFDFDGDVDVDLFDFREFQNRFTG